MSAFPFYTVPATSLITLSFLSSILTQDLFLPSLSISDVAYRSTGGKETGVMDIV